MSGAANAYVRETRRRVLGMLAGAGDDGLFVLDVAKTMNPGWTDNAKRSRANEILTSFRRKGWADRSERLVFDYDAGKSLGYRWYVTAAGLAELKALRAGDLR